MEGVMDNKKLAQVVLLFHHQQSAGAFPGGQLVLMGGGKTLLNEAIGVARGFRPSEPQPPIPVQPSTPFPALSAGKPLAAIAIALLEDRGLLDVHAPIAQLFPEFARHGKEHITTLDVLTHRSGLLMPDFVRQPHLWGDRAAVQQAMIAAKPTYPRGTPAYHPYEYGWLLSEIVHRVDGRPLPTFFHEEIALPLHLPDLRFGLGERDPGSVAFSYWLGKAQVNVAGINVAENFEQQNSALYLDAQNPATSLVCSAASLAAFYDWLLHGDKSPAGPVPLQENTLRKYTTRQVRGYDRSLRTPISLGRGFVVGAILPSTFGWWNTVGCFGHAGGFSSLAFGDYRTGIAAAIVTNGNRGMNDVMRRFLPLAGKMRQASLVP
jgi:CubicO group peptidase (beta-lactamase class C family)